MKRTWWWLLGGGAFCTALIAGSLLAQNSMPGSSATDQGAPPAAPPPTYKPVSVESLATASSAAVLQGSYVRVADYFQGWVPAFPADVQGLGYTPQEYVAFRTQPYGSHLICFVPRSNPDAAALQDSNPVPGTEVYLMGLVGPPVLAADGVATAFRVDRVVLGHEEPRVVKSEAKKSVTLMAEKAGPDGIIYRQTWTIKTPGQAFWLPDPSDPNNDAKKIRVTLQF